MIRLLTLSLFSALILSAQTTAVISQPQGEYLIPPDPLRSLAKARPGHQRVEFLNL
jgi:hypothetical protein